MSTIGCTVAASAKPGAADTLKPSNENAAAIELRDLTVRFGAAKDHPVLAVDHVSLSLARGEGMADLAIERIDGKRGVFAVDAGFSNATRVLKIDVTLDEAADGILANLVGIGRGTDLVLYAFIVSFLIFMATTYQRFRAQEVALTKLSRRIALKEAEKPWLHGSGSTVAASDLQK